MSAPSFPSYPMLYPVVISSVSNHKKLAVEGTDNSTTCMQRVSTKKDRLYNTCSCKQPTPNFSTPIPKGSSDSALPPLLLTSLFVSLQHLAGVSPVLFPREAPTGQKCASISAGMRWEEALKSSNFQKTYIKLMLLVILPFYKIG